MNNHKAYVGPPQRWGKVRKHYFAFLRARGLLPTHTICDVGCGTMRNGLRLISYLERGRYIGIEGNLEALKAGIKNEISAKLKKEKEPRFIHDSDFSVDTLDKKIDWICSYAVFIHCGRKQLEQLLGNIRNLVDNQGSPVTLAIDLNIGTEDVERGVKDRGLKKALYEDASHVEVAYTLNTATEIFTKFRGEVKGKWGLPIDNAFRKQFIVEFTP